MADLYYCKVCLKKQQRINQLVVENERLRARLNARERSAKEGPFGSATPSSKMPFKANALPDPQERRGGGRPGHVGHGRQSIEEAEADLVESVEVETQTCPDCGVRLHSKGQRKRTVTELRPPEVIKVLYRLGRIEQQTGVGYGALIQPQKQLARLLSPAIEKMITEYRQAPVKHAGETGWRTDGRNGYAWLFATPKLSLFRFRQSRSGAVAGEVLAKTPLPGVLVVDRYSAYHKAPIPLQYCYAHLKRTVEDLEKQFPDQREVVAFVESLAPTLGEAMHLRTLNLPRKEFTRRAARINRRIIAIVHRHASHRAIQKVSFGSQSEPGARTRETLMTILHTLKKRVSSSKVAAVLQDALDRLAEDRSLDPWALLFEPTPCQHLSYDQD
jgi:hypothetical protein